jgi:hypothetical protein
LILAITFLQKLRKIAEAKSRLKEMRPIGILSVLAALLLFGCDDAKKASNAPDEVSDAFRACEAFKQTGLVSECNVHGFGRSIEVRIDTSGEEAQKMCPSSVAMILHYAPSLSGKWNLQIFSPFSGDHPLATCQF